MEDDRDEGDYNKPTKLFVGQIPKEMGEEELATYFEGFGPIRELSIIRDTVTAQSKGCAFLTYLRHQSALDAVDNLHDRVKLPNAANPLQVRFAETPLDRENKLFVGMLPKTFSEQELQQMFQPFGDLKEVHIIRGPEGSPKGCAFVKFINKEAAIMAIDSLNETIPQGSTRPLVVKFADNKKGKSRIGSDGSEGYQPNLMSSKPEFWYGMPDAQPYVVDNLPGRQNEMMYQYQFPPRNMSFVSNSNRMPHSFNNATDAVPPPPSALTMHGHHNLQTPPMLSHKQMYSNYSSGVNAFGSQVPSMQGMGGMNNSVGSHLSMNGPGVGGGNQPMLRSVPSDRDMMGSNRSTDGHSAHHLRPPEGPNGANLFIYHLPRDLTDADLATLFAPFGNVISAKVFVDKKTSDSKGFGFVSYDSFESANTAIESMNGFQIGSKRLKVQHKRVNSGNSGSNAGLHGSSISSTFDDNFGYGGNGGASRGLMSVSPTGGNSRMAMQQPQHMQPNLAPPPMMLQPMNLNTTQLGGQENNLTMFSRYDMPGGNYLSTDSPISASLPPHLGMNMRFYPAPPPPPTHMSSPMGLHIGMQMGRPALSMPTQIISFQQAPQISTPTSQQQQMNALQSSFESFGLQSESESGSSALEK